MLEGRTTMDLMSIAGAGGGFDINVAGRTTMDLMSIAGAAAKSGARLTFRGLASRTTMDLMSIAGAGKGTVQFAD
jgi:uncharacterized protein (UPF0303 family)